MEIDKEVVSAGKEFFFVPKDERFDITTEMDGFFLEKQIRNMILLFLDAYDKTYVPFHLMTKNFISFKESFNKRMEF
ncbi:MAG: hypothetical protein CM1200mP13_12320 [Candidatus Pelagibacterales bacterium]|nr:MAG: hypothetical protein CM1200mP13_12320 [Pelagibacterales bacterium]